MFEIKSINVEIENQPEKIKVDKKRVISTGSTLLDLEISGHKVRGGGLPSGVLVEIFGPSGVGKTALLSEIASSCQKRGGEVLFCDPEDRLDLEYAKKYDFNITRIEKPDTVRELFDIYNKFKPNPEFVNVFAADSLAALSSEIEMKDGIDKMGMKRAKDFSECLRVYARTYKERNIIFVCSNQVREKEGKMITPGGLGVGFYASIRLKLKPCFPQSKISITRDGFEKTIGIKTEVEVYKNSVGNPKGIANLNIIFNYGIDDVRANIEYLKTGKKYEIFNEEFSQVQKAIDYVEEMGLVQDLRELVIKRWYEVDEKFKTNRTKQRI